MDGLALEQSAYQLFVGSITATGEYVYIPKIELLLGESLCVTFQIIADRIELYLGPRAAEMMFNHFGNLRDSPSATRLAPSKLNPKLITRSQISSWMDGVRFVESPTFYPSDSQPAPYSNQITAPHEMMQNFLEFLDRPRLIPAVVDEP
jgi:hypothetical protein